MNRYSNLFVRLSIYLDKITQQIIVTSKSLTQARVGNGWNKRQPPNHLIAQAQSLMFHKVIKCLKRVPKTHSPHISKSSFSVPKQNQPPRFKTSKLVPQNPPFPKRSNINNPHKIGHLYGDPSPSGLGVSKRFLQTNKVILSQFSNSNNKYMSHKKYDI